MSSSLPKKILFVLPDLQGGGAERTAINLLSGIDDNKYKCRIMALRSEGVHLQTAIDAGWLLPGPQEPKYMRKWKLEDPLRILFSAWQIRKVAVQFKPDIILTFMSDTSIPMYLSRARAATDAFWVAREGNHTPRTIQETIDSKFLRIIANLMVGISLRSCDRLLCISNGMIETFSEAYQVSKEKIAVIYNPIDLEKLINSESQSTENFSDGLKRSLVDQRPMILAVGRLSYQKGFDVLIRSFAKTLANKNFQLTILGEGELREELENLVLELKLTDCVHMPGYHESPAIWMTKAHCFVLSSRWEGFGHVVAEAMTVGTPVISTRCQFGPEEILENGLSGKLISEENQVELEAALMEMTDKDQSIVQQRVVRARQRAKDFSMEKIIAQYEDFFSAILKSRGKL